MERRNTKIKNLKELTNIVQGLKKEKKLIVFTNGCFDLFHAGHLKVLEKSKMLGDILIVGINSDKSIKKIKGNLRPIIPQRQRVEIVSALGIVNYVVLFDERTPLKIIKKLKPYIITKGGDYNTKEIVGEELISKRGGIALTIDLEKDISTTGIIQKILKKYKNRKV